MRQRIPVLALALAAMAACAPSYGSPSSAPSTRRDAPGDLPMDARLFSGGPDGRLVWLSMNQPGYVAVFELRPGAGVALVYPDQRFENVQLAGGRWVDTDNFTRRSWHLTGATTGWFGSWADTGMRVYLLIASKQPLNDLDRFIQAPESLRRVLGVRYNSISDMDVADALIDHVVPPQPDGDWTTDVLVVWPNEIPEMYRPRLVGITCSDGTTVVVPENLAAFACRQRDSRTPPPAPDTTASQPGDVQRPTGRRPQPGEGGARPEGERETIREVERRERLRPTDPQDPEMSNPRGRAPGNPGNTTDEPAGRREPVQPVERRVERPTHLEREERAERQREERQQRQERQERVERHAPPQQTYSPPPQSSPPSQSPSPAPSPSTGGGRVERPVP